MIGEVAAVRLVPASYPVVKSIRASRRFNSSLMARSLGCTVLARMALQLEDAPTGSPTDVSKPKKVKGFRFAETPPCPSAGRISDQIESDVSYPDER